MLMQEGLLSLSAVFLENLSVSSFMKQVHHTARILGSPNLSQLIEAHSLGKDEKVRGSTSVCPQALQLLF